mmetsp:Transcript_19104/g.24784  ORF Transcript_19104/g.24784 Transcript_19104/m.24784 type:complete len:220 (-) Transcript_19104:535-1194(-)
MAGKRTREDDDWVRRRPEKIRDSILLEWDQDNVEQIIADACIKILKKKKKIAIRGLVDELSRQVHLTKRGHPVAPKAFITELGGTKLWLERLCTSKSEVYTIGNWPNVTLSLAPVPMQDILTPQINTTVQGKCIFWDYSKGYGKLVTADGIKVFAHCRDITVGKSIPRGANVRFIIVPDDHRPFSHDQIPRYAARAILINDAFQSPTTHNDHVTRMIID